jgi:enoyl-[acyl-carrier protein] reductase I
MEAGWDDVATAVQVSAYSLASLTKAALPLMADGRQRRRADLRRAVRLAGLRLDGRGEGARSSRPTATWPATSGPGDPRATSSRPADPHDGGQVDPRLRAVREEWGDARAARLGRQRRRARRAACVRPAVGLVPATTGEIVHVDGGFHAMGV